jgi:hypothetical protein
MGRVTACRDRLRPWRGSALQHEAHEGDEEGGCEATLCDRAEVDSGCDGGLTHRTQPLG